ncbi:MAG: hypothetical protein ACRYHQ_08295 [Janthinobacterium lividum]
MNDFPSLKDDLRPRAKLKRHTEAPATDEEIDANSRLMGAKWGASTSIPSPPAVVPQVAPVVSIRGYIPNYLDDELTRKSAERRVTKTFLIMEALEKAGYHLDKADLVQDRRKRQRKQ